MSIPENQLLLLKDDEGNVRPAFLVLTREAESDFTFYVRDDSERVILRQILQKESGLAASTSPREETSFSCQMHVLHPLLHKDDFKRENNRREGLVFLRKLRKSRGVKASSNPYAALWRELDKKLRHKLDAPRLDDEELAAFIEVLNGLMAGGFAGDRFGNVLPLAEKELLDGLNRATQTVLGNHLKFCSLFRDSIKPTVSRLRVGRVMATLSYEGDCWSVSFRKLETGTGYEPSKKDGSNLNTIEEICHTLYEEIFYAVSRSESARRGVPCSGQRAAAEERSDQKGHPQLNYGDIIDKHRRTPLPELGGLVIIAGSTNSAKSLITRGLIHLYLENVLLGDPRPGAKAPKANAKRRAHLVTFEDPIEKYFIAAPRTSANEDALLGAAHNFSECHIDYTPRQQGVDAPDLQTALYDALRQTPKVFFVGETRRNEDWRALIDFAGTGHLVITTAHAGSLIEAMHKILLATKARTPADRNEVASRILAIVQLKRTEVEGFEQLGVLVPSLWRRVPRGVNSLTAEGLASILPHSQSGEVNPCSCLGRKYFAERLLGLAGAAALIKDNNRRPPEADFVAALKEKAIGWDLQGA
jgi:hypothetical protein